MGVKGVWLRLDLGQSILVPEAVGEGFKYHHAEPVGIGLLHDRCQPAHMAGPLTVKSGSDTSDQQCRTAR